MNIGIIGFGNMGRAIGERISKDYSVLVFDRYESKLFSPDNDFYKKCKSAKELVEESSVIILAIKPQDFDNLINEIYPFHENKLFISIAVGISTKYLESKLPTARVIRVMPNLPAQIGKGLSVLSAGFSANSDDINLTEEVFLCVGKTLLMDEKFMNIVTAISGSGPGFYFRLVDPYPTLPLIKGEDKGGGLSSREQFLPEFISSLQKIAEDFGFSSDQARILAEETGKGSEAYLREMKIDPKIACQKVTSKGGTTEAGLAVLKNLDSLKNAIISAEKRAEELNK